MITFQVDLKEVETWFGQVKVILKDPNKVLRAAFNAIGYRDVMDHFRKKEGPDGAWAPRKIPQQVKTRGGRIIDKPLLEDTGRLKGGFMPGNIQNQGTGTIVFYNPVPYAATHDLGSDKKNIPQRSFMWLSDEAMERMTMMILDQLESPGRI